MQTTANAQALTYTDLLALEESTPQRYELWNGRAYAMTGGTLAHNRIALGLYNALRPQMKPGCRLYVADALLRLPVAATGLSDQDNNAYPDVMMACGEPPSTLFETRPVLLAEVLSDSSARRDRVTKLNSYRELESLEAYLILAQEDVIVDVYERARQWNRERYQGVEARIRLERLGFDLALGAVYADVLGELGYS